MSDARSTPHEHTTTAVATKAKLVSRLIKDLPRAAVLHQTEDLRPYECDGLSAYRKLPMVVALPSTVEQVALILSICHELNIPVVARGAGTGLSGGALPHEHGLLLSLAKFQQIIEYMYLRFVSQLFKQRDCSLHGRCQQQFFEKNDLFDNGEWSSGVSLLKKK